MTCDCTPVFTYMVFAGTWLASGSDDLKVVVWDVNTGKPYISFNTGHKSNVFQVVM